MIKIKKKSKHIFIKILCNLYIAYKNSLLQRKSREESKGKDSGVEIIKNEPYTEGYGGSGQYTQKKYFIASHVPS